ncbi:hypothetical protein FGADI_12111 [Fusarium gaditjirri]|uniref:Short-chain dehydrogenase n=1 Tax=Fusarium gaditjirri TaxID=282569 RepID=A0A8H4WP76_9HYPO|nr:hypothetical protein FGADI_12111 [Fusarium gaditjirri]
MNIFNAISQLPGQITQAFPPAPAFTETELPDLFGKVYIITGATSGIGLSLAHMLYQKNAKVYLGGRSIEKGAKAVQTVQESCPDSIGHVSFLYVDLADLSTIKNAAQQFLQSNERLDVLFNNAGVMIPPHQEVTKQGHDLQIGTNCLGPFLLTKLLTPAMIATSRITEKGSVRVVWVSSSIAELGSPQGGIILGELDNVHKSPGLQYGISKAGNFLYAREFARRYKEEGIISVALNPGIINTDLKRHGSSLMQLAFDLLAYSPRYGALTELYAGLSPELSLSMTGSWIIPWGRVGQIRKDLELAARTVVEGGNGNGSKFWEWSEGHVEIYM